MRVRPVSGQTRAGGAGGDLDETKTNMDGIGGKDGKSLGDAGDDEEKFNRILLTLVQF